MDEQSIGNVFQALADPTRLAVVHRLGRGSASTTELAQPFDMALPSFMQHLDVLEKSGLITSKKAGRVRTWTIEPRQLDTVETWLAEQRALWEDRTDRLVAFVEEWYAKEQALAEQSPDFMVSRLIKAPRRLVWEAWTNPQMLEQWWCPTPMTATVTRFDLRVGGAFDLMMRDPDGNNMPQTGAFLDIMPQERIVFTTALTHEWRPATTMLPITGVISMKDEGEGTRYETRVLYRDDEARRQMEQIQFEAGWTLAIDQLERLVLGGKP